MARISINIPNAALEELQEYARRVGKSVSQVCRDGIALEKWFDTTRREGGKILVERQGGKAREIIPR